MKVTYGKQLSRLRACECESGLRYRDCHGKLDLPPGLPFLGPVPAEIVARVREHERQSRAREREYGEVRPIIATEFAGHQFVAVGGRLMVAKDIKVFPDALNHYLHSALNRHWGSEQVALPFNEQHPVIQWRTIFTAQYQNREPDQHGLHSLDSGAANAWFRLAYDLYLLEHHGELQKKLLKRLKSLDHFQGARLEIVAAAAMLPAGYELDFEDDKRPGRHPEFVAVHKRSGQKIAVEAKSRHRPGVLGFKGSRSLPKGAEIQGLLKNAIEKNPEHPLLIFVELNLPLICQEESVDATLLEELKGAWASAQNMQFPGGFPAVGVIFYNDAAPWFLDVTPPAGPEVTAIAMWPEKHRHPIDSKVLLSQILKAIRQRLKIPVKIL